jgi:hypothetical protein
MGQDPIECAQATDFVILSGMQLLFNKVTELIILND